MDVSTAQESRVALPTDPITESVIGLAMDVHNKLGNGFLERMYENALALDLRSKGHDVSQQKNIDVIYHGEVVGVYIPGVIIDNQVIVEIKAVRATDEIFMAQCKNYLKATGLEVCLLINFGQPSLVFKRILRKSIR